MRHPSHDAQTLLPLVYNSQPQAKYFPVWPPHSVSKYIVFRLRYSLYLKVQFFFRSLTLRKHLQSQMSIVKILFLWNMMTVLESSWITTSSWSGKMKTLLFITYALPNVHKASVMFAASNSVPRVRMILHSMFLWSSFGINEVSVWSTRANNAHWPSSE